VAASPAAAAACGSGVPFIRKPLRQRPSALPPLLLRLLLQCGQNGVHGEPESRRARGIPKDVGGQLGVSAYLLQEQVILQHRGHVLISGHLLVRRRGARPPTRLCK
jgi:hypothetical protein